MYIIRIIRDINVSMTTAHCGKYNENVIGY